LGAPVLELDVHLKTSTGRGPGNKTSERPWCYNSMRSIKWAAKQRSSTTDSYEDVWL